MPLKTTTPNTQAPKLSFLLDPLALLMATKPSIRSAKMMIELSLSKLSKGKTKNYHIIDKTLSGALNALSKAEKRALFAYLIEHDHISTILSMCDFGHFQCLIQLIDSPICILEELKELSQEYQVITYGIITEMLSGFDSFASQRPQACLEAFIPIHKRLTKLQVASICDDLPILENLMTGLTTLLTQHKIEQDEAQQQNLIQFIAHITTLCAYNPPYYGSLIESLSQLMKALVKNNTSLLSLSLQSSEQFKNLLQLVRCEPKSALGTGVIGAYINSYPSDMVTQLQYDSTLLQEILLLCEQKSAFQAKIRQKIESIITQLAQDNFIRAMMILRHGKTKALLRQIYPMAYDALVCEGKLCARRADDKTSQSLRLFRSPENREGVYYKTGQYTQSASAHNVQSPK